MESGTICSRRIEAISIYQRVENIADIANVYMVNHTRFTVGKSNRLVGGVSRIVVINMSVVYAEVLGAIVAALEGSELDFIPCGIGREVVVGKARVGEVGDGMSTIPIRCCETVC